MTGPMRHFMFTRVSSFRHAFSGWWFVLRTQQNAWIHAFATMLVIGVSIWLQLPALDWAIVLIAITLVWTAEFINTALETTVDLASPGQHDLAKIGKDVGAAAVLIASVSAALIGLLVLGPPLFDKIKLLLDR